MNQPLAYIHPGAKISKNVVVEPFTTIHNNVRIGDGTWIGSNVTIMEGARIGKNCNIQSGQVFHNCRDYSNIEIGDNCHIGKNCFFDLRNKIVVGKNVTISMQCTFLTHIDLSNSRLSNIYPKRCASAAQD